MQRSSVGRATGIVGRVQSLGVDTVLDQPVERLQRDEGQWKVVTRDHVWHARRLIVTTGGCSYPGCGTRGDAYQWMADLGHTIVTPRPALAPLTSPDAWVRKLSGLTLDDTTVSVVPHQHLRPGADLTERLALIRKHHSAERRAALLFTHFGVSGPAAMDVSREVSACAVPLSIRLICDLTPSLAVESLLSQLQQAAATLGNRSIGRWLGEQLPQRLADTILDLVGMDPQLRLAELNKRRRQDVVKHIKSLEIMIDGTRGFAKAEVTAGGVALPEVNSRTMSSKRVEGLYIAGELLDVDGPIGGYNFQAAFSTGWAAGSAAAG